VRSKLVPESLAERVALWAGKVPVPIVDTIFPLVKARALMAAERLGIFEALRDAPLSTSGLAGELGLDQESLSLLLRVLVASGYLAERAGRYQLSHLARKTLLRGSPLDSRGFLRFNYTQWRLVEHLEHLLQTGQSLDLHQRMLGSQDWENYQRAMLEIARSHAPILARRVPVRRGARLLVDVAGSHGLLGAAICRRHVPLRSRVLELPVALGPAQRLAQEERIDDVVAHVPGDLRTDELGSGVDVILLANIVHHLSQAENLDLLCRAHRALTPGGTLAVWDIERHADGAQAELGRDAIALFFRLTSSSRCFSEQDLWAWLKAAGFTRVRSTRSPFAPLHLLVHARK
jgi:hypothetical protein